MGYFKKRIIRGMVIAGALALSLTGCGSAPASTKEEIPENETAKVPENDGNKDLEGKAAETSETPEAAPETSKNQEAAENEETRTEGSCISERPVSDIPVYGAKDEDNVREYLAGLPNRHLTYDEAREWGMIYCIWGNREEDKKQREKFDEQWLEFYQTVTRKDLEWNVEEGEFYHSLAVIKAFVFLRYTVEGDPIYDYLSCINGDYYFYSDCSRDEYGGGYSDGSYKDLRMIIKKGDGNREYSCFYLVKDRKITDRKIEKMIDSEEGYDIEKLREVYSLDYVLEDD